MPRYFDARTLRRKGSREHEENAFKDSFTLDVWTSEPGDPYISLTAHYIGTHVYYPNMWELRSKQLFQEIQGRHTGKNSEIFRAVDRYELRGGMIFLLSF